MKTCMLSLIFAIAILSYSCNQPGTKADSGSDKEMASAPGDTSLQIVRRSINLPEPFATKSSVNLSKVIGWSDNGKPTAPAGFTVTKYAGNMLSPRWIYVLPNGDVLVAQAKREEKGLKKVMEKVAGVGHTESPADNANNIIILRDADKDGTPDFKQVFLNDLNQPFGMLLLKNYFYVANTDGVWRYDYKEGATSITSAGTKIIDLPTGGHWTRNIIANAAGTKIYIAVGSSTNVADNGMEDETNRACIIEINPDGTGKRIYASGLRNPVGMDWRPGTNTLYTSVNERDALGDDLVPDYMTSVQEGGFYGWPYSYYGNNIDPRIKEKDQKPDLVNSAIVPDIPLGAHTASLGLAFYDKKPFPEKYHNGAFIGQHGSWNRSEPVGYKVVFVPFNGANAGVSEDFLTGFVASKEKNDVYGRPVGVTVLPDGSLLVADDAGDTIWRVSYSK